jgi:YHS domain-containing protein
MKIIKLLSSLTLIAAFLAGPLAAVGAEQTKAKPYPLNTCAVSGEKLDMGKPYVFVHEGQEVKLCCKDCLKDFKKEPAKYMKKIQQANAKK